MKENGFTGIRNRILQHIARFSPGARSLRVMLHRWRGVQIGKDVWIGYDSVLETSRPHLISIGDRAQISLRVTMVAHFHALKGITIEEDVFVGPGAIILPNVTIGKGAVVTAGSVVSVSIPPGTLVQGNPARPVAKCGIPLSMDVTLEEFQRRLKPIGQGASPKR